MSAPKRLIWMLALIALGRTAGGQRVMTFTSLATPFVPGSPGYVFVPSPYEEGGVRLSAGLFCTAMTDSPPFYAGDTGLSNCLDNGVTTLTKIGGGTFSLSSIDLAPFGSGYGFGAAVTFVGTPFVGPPVTATFNAPGSMVFETHHFTGFDNLTSVSWQHVSPYHQFDNITLDVPAATVSPEPASLVLVASGLVAVAALTRRRR